MKRRKNYMMSDEDIAEYHNIGKESGLKKE
jgi:hypothetical protein